MRNNRRSPSSLNQTSVGLQLDHASTRFAQDKPLIHSTAGKFIRAVWAAGMFASLGLCFPAKAAVYQEAGGVVVIEAEHFDKRVVDPADANHNWKIVPDENPGTGSGPNKNARGNKYVQSLPDADKNNGGDAAKVGIAPYLEYKVAIKTTGIYRLFLRFGGWDGSSDSIYAQIMELKTSSGGPGPDWYRYIGQVNAATDTTIVDFALVKNSTTGGAAIGWNGDGAPSTDSANGTGGGGGEVAANWNIAAAGTYTIRISQREDGSALDAILLQLASLPQPTNPGPAESATAPISFGANGVGPLTFDTQPAASEWATTTVAGGSGDITTAAGLNTAVQTVTASSINTQLPSAAGNPPAAAGTAQYASEGKYLLTRPTGVLGNVLLGTFQNNSGAARSSIVISYNLTVAAPVTEEVLGPQVFYSVTGAPNSWKPIPDLNAATDNTAGKYAKTATVDVGTWAAGANLYVLFADDNGSGSPDTANAIDDFAISLPGIAVPANLSSGAPLTTPGGNLRGEYWKRPVNSIPTDGASNKTNRIDTLIKGFGAANGTFKATKLVYTGNDLTIITNWLGADASSFTGTVTNLDDGAIRLSGFLNVPASGAVNLGTTSDDGSRITIGGIDIINNDSGHGNATVDTNVVFAAAGIYPIEITYFNGDWTNDGTGAKLNHSGSVDPAVHGGAEFHLRVAGADVTTAGAGMFYPFSTTAFTTKVTQASGQNWTAAIWDPGATTPSAGNTYTLVDNGTPFGNNLANTRIRNVDAAGLQTFPGDSLTMNTNTEIRAKGVAGTILNFPGVGGKPGLILKGGVLNAGSDVVFGLTGRVEIASTSYIVPADNGGGAVTPARGFNISGIVSGSGGLVIYQAGTNVAQELSGNQNTYTGNILVKAGYLKGSGTGSLGTGNITLDPKANVNAHSSVTPVEGPAILEIGYDINSPGTLTLNNGGKVILHQNATFANIVIDGQALNKRTYTYAELVKLYPNNFAPGGSGAIISTAGPLPPVTLVEFKFDEGTGSTVKSTDGKLTGTFTGTNGVPAFSGDTPSGKAGDFSLQFGVGQRVTVPDPAKVLALDTTDASFTVEAWVKFATPPGTATFPSGRSVYFFNNGPGGAVTASMFIDRTLAVTTLGVKDQQSAAPVPNDGGWHHIAIVHQNKKEFRFYIDGILADIQAYTGGVIFTRTETSFSIGSEANGGLQYVGFLDRLRYTKGMLAPAQFDSVSGAPAAAAKVLVPGFLLREQWNGLGGGVTLDALTNNVRYPKLPNFAVYQASAEIPVDVADQYAARLSGFIVPQETQIYTFFISSDDNSNLFLSTDDNPANKKLIAVETAWSNTRQWTTSAGNSNLNSKRSDKFADSQWPTKGVIVLFAGKKYFIEGIMKEGGGGDNFGIAWTTADPPPDGSPPIDPKFFAVLVDPTKSSIAITKQPVGGTALEGPGLTLSVTATGTSDVTINQPPLVQWQKDGADIAGATSSTLAVTQAGSGKYRAVLSVPGKSVTSDEVTVTINPDVTPPMLLSAEAQLGNLGEPQVKLTFSEALAVAGAANVANYAISGGTVRSAKLLADGKSVALTVNTLAPGVAYTITVNNLKDLAVTPNTIAANSTAVVPPFTVTPGFLRREMFKGLSTTDNTVAGLTNTAKFPNSPDVVNYLTQAEGPVNIPAADGGEGYGTRLSGFVIPPETGNYVFYVCSDDNSSLFLSTDDNPANKKLIAIETVWSNNRQWITSGGSSSLDSKRSDKYAGSQWPTKAVITLTAGKLYYIEALHKEGSGGDDIGFTWRLPSQSVDPVAGSDSIQAGFLAAFATIPGADVTITSQPKPVTVAENGTAIFTVAATGTASGSTSPPISVQWQRNGVNLTGRTGTTLTLAGVKSSDSGSIRAVVSVPGKSVNSDAVTLTVNADITPPTLVSANAWARPNNVTVTFSEPITDTSGNNVGSFSINNGAVVQSAKKTAANVVELTTTTLARGTPYVLIVNGIQDLASTPNTIAKFSTILINTAPALPTDFGQTVNGYQQDFGGDNLPPGWVPRAGAGARTDLYTVSGGMLHVGAGLTGIPGDPSHLLYEGAAYNPTNQEVLARVRIVAFGTGDGPRGGVGVAVNTAESRGINLHFRDSNQGDGGVTTTGRAVRLLDDARNWGPGYQFHPLGGTDSWVTNTWYWLRLKQAPNSEGAFDIFGKAWLADGTTLEPADWNAKWDHYPGQQSVLRVGFAGITGGSSGGLSVFDVDYFLLKADGLPSVKVEGSQVPPPIVVTANGPVGGPLESGSTVANDALTGSYTVTGGGSDIWSAFDQFQYGYQTIAGDFDVQVRLESLEPRNKWSKAGIMVREQLVGNSRHAFERATPAGTAIDGSGGTANDVRFAYKTGLSAGVLGEHEDGTGSPPYPNTWLRLRRTGSEIVAYRGTNGVDWVQQGQQDTGEWEGGSFNDAVFLGLAVTSHNDGAGQTARAEFRQYGPTPPSAIKALAITKQPTAASAVENQVANFSVTVDDPFFFQWFKNGVPIPGATRPNLHLTTALADNNATISVVASNAVNSVTSANAVLTVKADTNAPTVVSAVTFGDPTHITVTFSKAVSSASATKAASYTLNNGVAIKSATQPNPTTVVLETATTIAPGVAPVALTVRDVQDLSAKANNITPNPASLNVLFSQGFITQKFFQFPATPSLANLTNDARFPNNPDFVTFEPAAEYPPNGANEAGDNYGNQLVGYVFAPVTGNYVFFLCSDDNSQLFLSTDANPANKKLIAQETAWSNARQWVSSGGSSTLASKRSDTFTGSTWPTKGVITLSAGTAYFIEVVHQEGGGGDNVGVTWQLPGAALPKNGDPPIPGKYLSTLLPSGPIVITKQPQSVTVAELGTASFSVEVTGTPPFSFQWSNNGVAVPSANVKVSGTTSTFALSADRTANNAKISVDVKNNFSSATSTVALLNVIADTTAPALLSATRNATNTSRVAVVFSEPVTAATANVAANYAINNGVTVSSATLGSDGRTVTLQTTPALADNVLFTLTVNGVKDALGNTIAANSRVLIATTNPIVTVTDTVDTFQNVAVSVSATKLVANDIAGAPGVLVISDVSARSVQGGTISFRGDSITYTPPTGFTGTDSFIYTAINSADSTANGLVIVNVLLPNQQSQNIVNVSRFGLGVSVVQFVGIPGRTYTIQSSTDLVTWKTLGPATASSRGVITFIDSDAGEAQKFYRTVFP